MAACLGGGGFAQALPQLETRTLNVSQTGRAQWHTVTFEIAFSQPPVVVMGPPSTNDSDGALPIVRNVTAQGFEFQLSEWDYLDGAHGEESVSYLALEPGTHDLGGLLCQAGRTTLAATANAQPATVAFPTAYSHAPVVLAQAVFASAGTEPLALRVTTSGVAQFEVLAQREEGRGAGAPEVEVNWIAVQPGWGHDWSSGISVLSEQPTAAVGSDFASIPFSRGTVAPSFLAAVQSLTETDPVALRYRALANRGVELLAQEETSGDAEVSHAGEEIGTLLIWQQPESKVEVGELDLEALEAGQWVPVEVAAEYENPVVILGPATATDLEPLTLRVRNAGPTGFEVSLQEYEYQDGQHALEHVPYLVMEEGIFQIDGKVWQSGTASSVAASGSRTGLFGAFAEAPVILGQVASDADARAAVVRISAVDETGFDLALQAQEAATTEHGAEVVQYVAVGQGASTTTTGLVFEAGRTAAVHDQAWREVSFARDYEEGVVFAATQTKNSLEPSGLRARNVGENSVELMVQEETSLDTETVVENPEALGWLVVGTTAYPKGDHDNDGMPDQWETAHGLDPNVNDASLDSDGDGLSNLEESAQGALPNNPDSDGDGYRDGFEVAAGWRPSELDGLSASAIPTPVTHLLIFTPAR